MAELADELAFALEDPGPPPTSGAELVRYAGGRTALARQLSGMEGPPKKRDYPGDEAGYKAASTRWRSASRRAQRWDDEGKAGKQRRAEKSGARLSEDQRERVTTAAAERKWSSLTKRGARMRIEALMQVKSPGPGKKQEPPRLRTLPAGGPGVWITGEELEPAMIAIATGDNQEAEFELLAAFGEAYGWQMEGLEILEVVRVKIWPEGTREPA